MSQTKKGSSQGELSVKLYETEYRSLYSPDNESTFVSSSDNIEISLVTVGNGMHSMMNEVTECHAGDIYVIGGNISHSYYAISETDYPTVITARFNIRDVFSGEYADRNSEKYCYGVFRDKAPVAYAMLNSNALSSVTEAFAEMGAEITTRRLEWREALYMRIRLLMIYLGRYINMADTEETSRPKEWITISTAIAEINERYGDSELTLATVAASLYISKSHLSRLFKKVTGEAFPEYIKELRIRRACELLSSTELTNEEIVRCCGLKDIPTFYRTFKAATGMTPHQYRIMALSPEAESEKKLMEIAETLQKGRVSALKELIPQAISMGLSAETILQNGLMSGMNAVGKKFKNNEAFVPEVLVAARAMNASMLMLKQYFSDGNVKAVGKVCIGTVLGDLHDIGKNLVKIMIEAKGIEVIDLGTDVPPESFVDTAIAENCRVICCSALLSTTRGVIGDVVKLAEERGIRDKVKILIGGSPIDEEFCRNIGADKYTDDAASAAEAVLEFCLEAKRSEG